jgi:hypothetical protein
VCDCGTVALKLNHGSQPRCKRSESRALHPSHETRGRMSKVMDGNRAPGRSPLSIVAHRFFRFFRDPLFREIRPSRQRDKWRTAERSDAVTSSHELGPNRPLDRDAYGRSEIEAK